MKKICIGLFGTCDNVKWRDKFIECYNLYNIDYFNPMVDNWNIDLIPNEAEHLKEDEIILLPVLKESYGFGSLNEIAFGPLKTFSQNKNRSFVILIEKILSKELQDSDEVKANLSKNSRSLVSGHLKELGLKNVYLASSLEEMLEISLKLYSIHSQLQELERYIA